MTDKKFWEVQQEFADAMEKAAESYSQDCDEYWSALSKDDQLKAFYSVVKRLHRGEIVEGKSYRGVLYETFGFGPESYVIGMECGFIDLHNSIRVNPKDP